MSYAAVACLTRFNLFRYLKKYRTTCAQAPNFRELLARAAVANMKKLCATNRGIARNDLSSTQMDPIAAVGSFVYRDRATMPSQ